MMSDLSQLGTITKAVRDLDDSKKRYEAAQKIDEWAHSELLPYITRRFGKRQRAGFMSEDILNLVLALFFRRGRFQEIQDRQQLLGLMRVIAKRRIGDRLRRETSARRSPGEDAQINPLLADEPARRPPQPLGGKQNRRPHAVDSQISAESYYDKDVMDMLLQDATPEQVDVLLDVADSLAGEFVDDPGLMETFKLLIQGFTDQEIAERLQVDLPTVRRRVARIKRRFDWRLPDSECDAL